MALSRDTASPRLSLWIPPLVIVVALYLLSATPDLTITATSWLDLVLRKAGHLGAYALLALTVHRALDETHPTYATRWAIGLSIFYALTDEYHQLFITGRHGTLTDVMIDAIGVLIGVAGWLVFRLWKPKAAPRRRRHVQTARKKSI